MNIRLIKPKFKELEFREKLLQDENTMKYNRKYGWTIIFPKNKWESWYYKWVLKPNKKFYRYVEVDGEFVGEACYRFDDFHNEYIMSIVIYDKYRNKGYGKNAISLLLNAAKKNGVKRLCDDIAADNWSYKMFLKNGFKIRFKNDDIIFVYKNL